MPRQKNFRGVAMRFCRFLAHPLVVSVEREPSEPSSRNQGGDTTMRVMVLVKADKDTEAGVMPSEQLLTDMMQYNEELVKAGIMLAGEGLHPSSRGKRVNFSGSQRTV